MKRVFAFTADNGGMSGFVRAATASQARRLLGRADATILLAAEMVWPGAANEDLWIDRQVW